MRYATILFSLICLSTFAGCTNYHQPPPTSEIPDRGMRVAQGAGRLFFAAPQAGTLYIYDADVAHVILAQPLNANERLVLDPQFRSITVENKPVPKSTFNHHHLHEFYFVPKIEPKVQ